MNDQQNLVQVFKNYYNSGGMHVKLIFYNAIVFLVVGIMSVIGRFSAIDINDLKINVFSLQTDPEVFIAHPWGIVTSIFTHFDFFHFLFNMLLLFFTGRMYEHFFGSKKLWAVYLLGGISGGIMEILAHVLFPQVFNGHTFVIGASGSIMAIFAAVAIYRPHLPVKLFGIIEVKIIFLALAYFIYDFLALGKNDGTAHFAHIGGLIFGYLTIVKPTVLNPFIRFWDKVSGFRFQRKSKKPKVILGGMKLTDEEYNAVKKARQAKIDVILEKISKSGYESLTTEEKNFLFIESNKK